MNRTILAGSVLAFAAVLTACQPEPGTTPAPTLVAGQPSLAPHSCRLRYAQGQPLPDPACTPGALNPAVTQAKIRSTICVRGWSSQQRAHYLPSSLAATFKHRVEDAYGIPHSADAEGDHDVPIELGGLPGPMPGAPDFTQNFWPEANDHPKPGTLNSKDLVENALHGAVCSGRVTLAAAQRAIEADWVTAEHAVGLK